MCAVASAANARRVRCSCGVVSHRSAATHWATAASHPAREKMKVMAGSRASASSRRNSWGREIRSCRPVRGSWWRPP